MLLLSYFISISYSLFFLIIFVFNKRTKTFIYKFICTKLGDKENCSKEEFKNLLKDYFLLLIIIFSLIFMIPIFNDIVLISLLFYNDIIDWITNKIFSEKNN